jgi:hypothetical protein
MGLEALDPLGDGLGIDAKRGRHGFKRLMLFEHPAHQFGSTVRRQAAIVMHVHLVLLEISEVCNSSFLGQDRMDNLLRVHN